MRRVEMMRKALVLAALVLILALLPTTPMAAAAKGGKPGPNPEGETYVVDFGGHLKTETSEPVTLEVMKSGWLTVYYGYANIEFQARDMTHDDHETGYSWQFFADRSENWRSDYEEGFGKVWIREDTRSGETWFHYQFDRYLDGETADRYVGWFKYELGGRLGGPFDPTGTTDVEGEFEIVQMFYYATSKAKKSATSVVYEWRWSGNLEFTISPPSP